MFAKLFSRITESSLMEEPLEVRYAFVMLLAMCDPTGHVIGTDIAIARRMNMPLDDFKRCAVALMAPDESSNSKEEEGRRIISSDHERGYRLVNYLTYRDMKTEESRRDYMRDYMQKYREKKNLEDGKQPVKRVSKKLASVKHAEEEAELTAEKELTGKPSSDHQKFIEDWCKYYEARTKTKYAFQSGKDAKAVKLLLGHFGGIETTKAFIKAVHGRAGTGFPFGSVDTLSDLANNISRLQAALALPPKTNGNGKHDPDEPRGEFAKPHNPPPQRPAWVDAELAEKAAKANGA